MFDLADVAATVNDKLVHRHPHVFGAPGEGTDVVTASDVEGRWEQIKKQEKGRASLVEGIPAALPALALAAKLERKLASVDLGWEQTGVPDDVLARGLASLLAGQDADRDAGEDAGDDADHDAGDDADHDDADHDAGDDADHDDADADRAAGSGGAGGALGQLLLALARRGAHDGADPEEALRRAAAALRRRVVAAERNATSAGADLAELEPMERLDAWRAGATDSERL